MMKSVAIRRLVSLHYRKKNDIQRRCWLSTKSHTLNRGLRAGGGGFGQQRVEASSSMSVPCHTAPTKMDGLSIQRVQDLTNDDTNQTSLLVELTDRVGVLHDVLKYFWKHEVNISRIESRPVIECKLHEDSRRKFDFFVDFDGQRGDPNVDALLKELIPIADKCLVLDNKEVHWFPRHISELDKIVNRTLDAGVDLEADHPGINDQQYRSRREYLAEAAKTYRWNDTIPIVEYSADEIKTWSKVYETLEPLWGKFIVAFNAKFFR